MKGFVYLLEIAIGAILMVVVLSIFFAVRIKQSWEASDLVATGNNMLNYISQNSSFFINILNKNLEDIERVKPINVNYGLNVIGSPKSNITVGYTQPFQLDYIKSLLTDVYVNGRWIGFDLERFYINENIPDNLDAIVLVNYTAYTSWKANIENYLNRGGVVIGINTTNGNDNDFNDIFGLTQVSAVAGNLNFSTYDPLQDDIEKYFLGFGFDIDYPSSWYIWEEPWNVVHLGPTTVNISRGSIFRVVNEGEVFDLPGPVGTFWFKLKKVWFNSRTDIQPLNKSFTFIDFAESGSGVTGKMNIIKKLSSNQAAMTSNNTAIWISDFPWSDEYRTLVKAAIASRNDEWTAKGVYTSRETTTVSSFFSLCCDMPETAELEVTLWYVV